MTELERKINELPTSLPGRFVYKFLPYKRQVIMANIDRVYGDQLNDAQKSGLLYLITRIY